MIVFVVFGIMIFKNVENGLYLFIFAVFLSFVGMFLKNCLNMNI